ncbi:PREDICTED: tripartite motif-containing protein 47 isoform X1 [Thamnophis sirtalis]|uniref:Tripartite motif-containing protein 47 isoform X1 n=1 Tax=Thamnophis sirtalis TaxID=35019 RepID=A0A6I9WZX9_9SAUR|nr:PREDICTED: tripartite motif-containing protein 47 isoform X1 [Thamnophis sirtalis]
MDAGSGPISSAPNFQEGSFGCPICLDALKDPVTTPCGHNFCLECLGAHRHHPGGVTGAGGQSASRCPLCQEPYPADLPLRKNHTLAELLQLRQPAPSSPGLAMAPEETSEPGAPGNGDAHIKEVLCDFCTDGERAEAAKSCLVCLASFCAPHLQPHLKSPAFQSHRLVPPLRHIEESLCKLHLKPLESFCRTDRSCICQLCLAQEHRNHEVVAVEVEREHVEAQRPKILNNIENQLDELGAAIAQMKRMVDLIKATAQKEKEKVSSLFTEATKVLATFKKEVLGFIEVDERAMLGGAEEELRHKEERHALLMEHKQNLEKVPSMDTITFLQEFQALKIAAEEKKLACSNFPRELSFIKSSQAVFAVKELLGNICKNQWDQLSGKGENGPFLHGIPEVTLEPQVSERSINSASLESRDYFLKSAFIIDLDSDTADKFIQLFGTKGAKRVLNPIAYPETSTRFINCEQVLGENLMNRGNYYWEVEIIDGWVSIGIITEDFNLQESYDRGRLGRNEKSCCLQWNGQNYVAWFGGFDCVIQQPFFHTIGVYLEYSEKVLTFYGVKDSKMTCLQQFKVARFKKGHFDPFQNKINHQFPALFMHNLKPAFFLESVDAHMQLGPLKKDCVSVLKRR